MKVIDRNNILIIWLSFAVILLLAVTLPTAGNTQSQNQRDRTDQVELPGATEMQQLMQQSDSAIVRYHDLQESGSPSKIRAARQNMLSANESVTARMSAMTGHPAQEIQAMHDKGIGWEHIMEDLTPQNYRDRQHADEPMTRSMSQANRYSQVGPQQSSGMGNMMNESNADDSHGGGNRGGGSGSEGDSSNGGGSGGGGHTAEATAIVMAAKAGGMVEGCKVDAGPVSNIETLLRYSCFVIFRR
jgi:hypothetical protein